MHLLKKDLKYDPRPEQQKALDFVAETIKTDENKKFFLLDLPVGVGKSYFAMMFADWYIKNVNRFAKFDVLTNSRILQEQYVEDFKSISNLWGKNNYQCSEYSCSCDKGKEFAKLNKKKCEECPYDEAKEDYMKGRISLTNFHMYILFQLYQEELLGARDTNVLIVDECLHPDTEITMDDNSKKLIKDIEIGDVVKTINEDNGLIENKEVKDVHLNLNKGEQMFELEMENGDILKITGNHKVFLTNGEWVKVEDLKGDEDILYIKENMKCHDFERENM